MDLIEMPHIGNDKIPEEHLLVHLCNLQSLERVVEVGVFGGNLTRRVLQKCPTVKKYYAVDPWKVYVESYDRPAGAREKEQSFWDSLYNKVIGIYSDYPDRLRVIRMESIACAKMLSRESISFDAVYLDGIHDAPNLVNDLYSWVPLINDYGTICGHDYIKRYKSMMLVLESVFEDDFNFWIVDPSKHRHSYKNQAQGGNWWVHLTPDIKKKTIERIRRDYPFLLFMGNQDDVRKTK